MTSPFALNMSQVLFISMLLMMMMMMMMLPQPPSVLLLLRSTTGPWQIDFGIGMSWHLKCEIPVRLQKIDTFFTAFHPRYIWVQYEKWPISNGRHRKIYHIPQLGSGSVQIVFRTVCSAHCFEIQSLANKNLLTFHTIVFSFTESI